MSRQLDIERELIQRQTCAPRVRNLRHDHNSTSEDDGLIRDIEEKKDILFSYLKAFNWKTE